MVLKTRSGFQLSGHLNGTVCPPAHRFQKAVDQGQNSRIFVGDPICLTSAGTVVRNPENAANAINANLGQQYIGVCTGIFEDERGRPLTHRTNKFAATADAFWIDVIDDPDAIWEVSTGASTNQTSIGATGYVIFASANETAGISGAGVEVSAASTTVSTPFRVVGIVNLNLDGQSNDNEGRVRVIAANHFYRQSFTTGKEL